MLDTLQAWDEALLLLLNGQPAWMADAAWVLTSKWAAAPVVLLMLMKLFARSSAEGVDRTGRSSSCVAGTDAISSRLFKPGFERPGPATPNGSPICWSSTPFRRHGLPRWPLRLRLLPCRQHLRMATLAVLLFGAGGGAGCGFGPPS